MSQQFTPQDALVAVMVTTSAADEKLSEPELLTIGRIIQALPAFRGYDNKRLAAVTDRVFALLENDDGLDEIIALVSAALPEGMNETAYALACDVAAADGAVRMAELRWLEILRQDLNVGRLAAAAIERGARARHLSPGG